MPLIWGCAVKLKIGSVTNAIILPLVVIIDRLYAKKSLFPAMLSPVVATRRPRTQLRQAKDFRPGPDMAWHTRARTLVLAAWMEILAAELRGSLWRFPDFVEPQLS
jgi:hypothetical protein